MSVTSNMHDFLVHRLVNAATTAASTTDSSDTGGDRGSCGSDTSSSGDTNSMDPLLLATAFPGLYAAAFAQLAQFQMMQLQQQQQQQPPQQQQPNLLPFFHPQFYQRLLMAQLDQPIVEPKQESPPPASSTGSRKRAPSLPIAIYGGKSPSKRKRQSAALIGDNETNSPVSGMYIKEAGCLPPAEQLQAEADLDDTAQFVKVTDESRRQIALIPNIIGDSVCCLCKVKYDDVFKLAQHRCPRIMHEEYRCPECDKMFSCPANLASHRRWHKPRTSSSIDSDELAVCCSICGDDFDTKKQLRSHLRICHESTNDEAENTKSVDNSINTSTLNKHRGAADLHAMLLLHHHNNNHLK